MYICICCVDVYVRKYSEREQRERERETNSFRHGLETTEMALFYDNQDRCLLVSRQCHGRAMICGLRAPSQTWSLPPSTHSLTHSLSLGIGGSVCVCSAFYLGALWCASAVKSASILLAHTLPDENHACGCSSPTSPNCLQCKIIDGVAVSLNPGLEHSHILCRKLCQGSWKKNRDHPRA